MSILKPTKTQLELLAPAGDWDSLLAAIAAGADAIYLGGKLFNARQNAANFDLDQLHTATDLLHLHHKKIYITVNTLVAESELNEALDYLNQLYNLGVDAIIIQDLGLIHLVQKYLPDLELHASTQMTVHNCEGAAFLKELGMKRVVLARELTKTEVESIARESGIEVEVFVHGALCVCYSGQCLMSSMIGGRSGNRGRCAQPCRMEYQIGFGENQLIPTGGAYLLSPKDIALINEIPELDRIGVTSLKIEGRMKRPEYVYQVVKIYRQALERYRENPNAFSVAPAEMQELEQSFNRGFSSGYFGGNRNSGIMGFNRPNNRGVYLGRISTSDRLGQYISLKLEADLERGDEVEVWISQGGRAAGSVKDLTVDGQVVNMAKAGTTIVLALEGRFHTGDRVFKIFAIKNDRETKQALDKDNPDIKIACSVEVSGKLDELLTIRYNDQEGCSGNSNTETPLQLARNRPLTREILWEQLSKLGNTPFYLTDLQLKIADNVMMPLSDLNQARRHAIEDLTAAKLKPYQKKTLNLGIKNLFGGTVKNSPKNGSRQRSLSVWVADYESVAVAANIGVDLIYVGGDELTGFHWTEKALIDAIEKAHGSGARLIIGLPRINRERQLSEWNTYLQMVLQLPADGIMVSELGTLQMVLKETERAVYLNYTFNFFNSYALSFLKNPQIKQITLSPELTFEQIKEIRWHQPDIRLECLVQGPLELMVSEYCPLDSLLAVKEECRKLCRQNEYFLRDRLQLDFPIYTDQYCRLHLLNAKDLCLYEDLGKLALIPDVVFRLELKTYPADRVGLFVKEYNKALEVIGSGQEMVADESVIHNFKSLTGRGITKGHYFRGVD
jgi:putative protease